MSTSARSRWPDIRFASSLWSRTSKDNSANVPAARSGVELAEQPVESVGDQNSHSDVSYSINSHKPATMAELEEPRTGAIGDLDDFNNGSESGGMDQDFGSLELFDSNHADAPFSSQANSGALESHSQAPTAVMSTETPQPKKSKDKKKKKKKDSATPATPDEPQPEIDVASSAGQGDDGTRSSSPRSKRKLSSPDAPEGKRQKKNRTPGSSKTSRDDPTEVTVDENGRETLEEGANSDNQHEGSEETSNTNGERSDAARNDDQVYDIENMDVENLAKEAWNEHVNGNTRRSRNATAKEKPTDSGDVEMEDAAEDAEANGTSNEKESENPDSTPQDAEPTSRLRQSARGKKAKPTYFEQPVQDVNDKQDDAYELPSPSVMTPKPRRRAKAATRKTQTQKRAPATAADDAEEDNDDDDAPRGRRNRMAGFTQGRFTDDELGRLSRAVTGFKEENDLTQTEVNEMIHAAGGTTAGEAHAQLWTRLFAECPDRHRQKVINITRKKFHNFVARGTWTTEQENELRDLIEVHGTKWSKIASIINRHPEDIRDRYRNYVVCGASQRKDAWNEDEESRLALYVMEAMQAIDDLRSMQPDRRLLRKSYEELIDWQNISERMERTRSRLQCITKWKSMNLRLHGNDQLESLQPDAKISFNLDRARHQLLAMPEEERHRLLLAIRDSAAGVEAKIPWQRLVDKSFRNEWHRTTQSLLWHRLKKNVPGWESKTVRDCAQYILDQLNVNGGNLPDVTSGNYDDAEEMQCIQFNPSSSQTKKANAESRQANAISDEYVMNSDAEDGDAGELNDDDIQIDPALTEAMAAEEPEVVGSALVEPSALAEDVFSLSAKKTPSKVATYGKKKGSARRGGHILSQDHVEAMEPEAVEAIAAATAAADQVENGTVANTEDAQMIETPSKLKSPSSKVNEADEHGQNSGLMSSDNEDMEDLPARVAAA